MFFVLLVLLILFVFLVLLFLLFLSTSFGSEFLVRDGLGVGLLVFLTGTAGEQLVEGD